MPRPEVKNGSSFRDGDRDGHVGGNSDRDLEAHAVAGAVVVEVLGEEHGVGLPDMVEHLEDRGSQVPTAHLLVEIA